MHIFKQDQYRLSRGQRQQMIAQHLQCTSLASFGRGIEGYVAGAERDRKQICQRRHLVCQGDVRLRDQRLQLCQP